MTAEKENSSSGKLVPPCFYSGLLIIAGSFLEKSDPHPEACFRSGDLAHGEIAHEAIPSGSYQLGNWHYLGFGLRKFLESCEHATAHHNTAFPCRVTPSGPWQART